MVKKRLNGFVCIGFLLVLAFAGSLCFRPVRAAAQEGSEVVFAFSHDLQSEYAVGERVSFPAATVTQGGSPLDCYILVQQGNKVVTSFSDASDIVNYTAEEAGQYSVVYCAKMPTGYVTTKSLRFETKEKPYIEVSSLPTEICVFDSFEVPEAKLLSDGTEQVAQLSITGPDGREYICTDGVFAPERAGVYTFAYSSELDGQTYSKMAYVQATLEAEDLFLNVANISSVRAGVAYPDYITSSVSTGGVEVLGRAGRSVLRYRNAINLNDLSLDDDLVEFAILCGEGYGGSNGTILVQLVDVYDPDKVVTVKFSQSRDNNAFSYITASSGRSFYGMLNENTAGQIFKDDPRGWGFVTNSSFGPYDSSAFRLHYDVATNRVMTHNKIGWGSGSEVVIDLDDPSHVGSDIFEGFTTGEVYLQIEYPALDAEGGIVIGSIAGQDFSGTALTDNVAPVLKFDMPDSYLDKMPVGIVGEEYSIPHCEAEDLLSAECTVRTSLTKAGQAVAMENGAFTPAEAGNYTLTYSATDAFGNTAEKTLQIEVIDAYVPMSVSLSDPDFTMIAGEKQALPALVFAGGSGQIDYSYTLTLNGNPLAEEEGEVLPFEKGSILMQIDATDYLGNIAALTVEIPVVSPEQTTLRIGEGSDAVTVGQIYQIPSFTVTDYEISGDEDNTYKAVFINGKKVDISGGYQVTEADGGSLEIEFVGGRGDRQSIAHRQVKVIESGDLSGYFLTEGAPSVTVSEQGTEFRAENSFAVKMPFRLSAENLYVAFSVTAGADNFSFVDVELYDSLDPAIKVVFRLTPKNETQSNMQINGTGTYFTVSGSFSDPDTMFELRYANGQRTISQTYGGLISAVNETAEGKPFHGFTSGAVKIRIRAELQKSNGGIMLNQIGNQVLSNMAQAVGVGPQLAYTTPMADQRLRIFDTFSVSAATAYDVLDYTSDVQVGVTAPDGTKLLSMMKADREFTFRAEQYGGYMITYTAIDASGHTTTQEFFVMVTEKTPPVIVVDGDIPDSVAAGSKIKIPEATVTDNIDPAPVLQCYIYKSDCMEQIPVSAGGEFVPEEAGEYRLVYYAFDATYNVTRVTMTFTVTE